MNHHLRPLVLAAGLVAATTLAACSSSGSDADSPSTTKAPASTTEATTTTEASTTTTEADGTTTTAGDGTTTTTAGGEAGPVDCQALLQEYADTFDPDDLAATVAFFRKYEPSMPPEVAEATERLAVAYDEAGDLGNLNLGDVDLTADAQTFSDWTNDGCPAP